MKDYSRLAGYIRNHMQEGKPCSFMLNKGRIFVVPSVAFGDTIPGFLVASNLGASVYVEPCQPLNQSTFMAGGFKLTTSAELARVFLALKASFKTIA